MNDTLLKIKNLHVSIENKEILKGIDLEIRKGEIHAVIVSSLDRQTAVCCQSRVY